MATWLEKMQGTTFTITTGDGVSYTPYWMSTEASRKDTFNLSQFEFKGIKGSYVSRGTVQGTKYDLTIIFQGDNQLDMSDAFRKSSANSSPWVITHPLYGKLTVQPTSLEYDNSNLNRTEITGTVIETISISGLAYSENLPDVIAQNTFIVWQQLNTSFSSNVPLPPASTMATLQASIDSIYQSVLAQMNTVQSDTNALNNAYNAATSVLNTALYDSGQIIAPAANLIAIPSTFANTVLNRLAMYGSMLTLLGQDVTTILGLTNTNTQPLCALYENNAGAAIAGMCAATVTNITNDYAYAPTVLGIAATIVSAYNTYVSNLNSLQSPYGGELTSYIPDPVSLAQLTQLVYLTVSNLYAIAQGALVAITVTLTEDTNIIPLTWDLYGPDLDDTYKQALIANNNLDMSELFLLPAGRKIMYYV